MFHYDDKKFHKIVKEYIDLYVYVIFGVKMRIYK